MNEEELGRAERTFVVESDETAPEAREERNLNERIDDLIALTRRALQYDNSSALSHYLSSTVADIELTRFLGRGSSDTTALQHMVNTVTEKLANPGAQITNFGFMIDALKGADRKSTSSSDAVFYYEEIRKLEAMKEELKRLEKI